MATTLRWFGDRVKSVTIRAAQDAVRQAGMYLVSRCRLIANTPAKRIRRRRVRNTSAGSKGSSYTEFIPSRPYQPPALRTGFGRRNIDMEFDANAIVARVGVRTSASYMIYLELGTGRIQPRPWLKPTTERSRNAIETMMRATLAEGLR